MKNVTVSVEDGLYRKARIKAAENGTSISALFKTFLCDLTQETGGETEFQRLQREEQELRAQIRARHPGLSPAHHFSREELHDRHALR